MATYFVDSVGGSDGNAGTSSGSPWQTSGKVFTHGYAAGDVISFKRNGSYAPMLGLNVSGTLGNTITWQDYGSGALPIFSGLFTIPSWSSEGGGLYSYTNASLGSVINTLTFDGVSKAYGRKTPGWATYTAHSESGTTGTITDAGLTAGTFAGGEVAIRKNHFVVTRGTGISIAAGGVVSYNTAGTNSTPGINGYGYFIQNHKDCCTNIGDWAYDSGANKLYVFFGGGGTGGHTVQVTNSDSCISFNGTSSFNYNIFKNLNLTGGNRYGINCNYGGTGNEVRGCSFSFNGVRGVWMGGSTGCTIDSNTFTNHCNNSIYCSDATSLTITNNSISDTGIIGMGRSDTDTGASGSDHLGAYMGCGIGSWNTGATILVQYNSILRSLYNGLSCNANPFTIDSNYIDTCCTGLDDGGCIYVGGMNANQTTFSPRTISNNICLNSIGATSGTNGNVNQGNGIYLDDGNSETTLSNNTIANCGQHNIFLHNNINITVNNNVSYNGTLSQLCIGHDNLNTYIPTGFNIFNNYIIANTTGQLCFFLYSIASNSSNPGDFTGFGTCNVNYYWSLSANTSVFQTQFTGNSAVLRTYSGWQAFTTKDASSLYSNQVSFLAKRLDTNPAKTSLPISLTGTWQDASGANYSTSYTLPPYGGQVLIQITAGGTSFVSYRVYHLI